MRILLFGKNGQLATMCRASFEERNISYVALDRDACDVRQKESVLDAVRTYRPTLLWNAAGYTNVDAMEGEGREAGWAVNAQAPKYMAEAAEELNIPLIHVGTDYVFDGQQRTPYRETDTPHPLNVYGASKLAGDTAVQSYAKAIILRVSWLYGPGEQNFVRKFLAFNRGKTENNITGDEYAVPTHVSSLLGSAMDLVEREAFGLYHVRDGAPDAGVSRAEYGRAIARLVGMDITLHEVPMASWNLPAERPAYSVLSTDKVTQILGREFPDWEANLAEYLRDFA